MKNKKGKLGGYLTRKGLMNSDLELADLRRRNLLGLAAVEAGDGLDPKAREQVVEALRGRSEAKVITALRLLIALAENPAKGSNPWDFKLTQGTLDSMRSAVAPFGKPEPRSMMAPRFMMFGGGKGGAK